MTNNLILIFLVLFLILEVVMLFNNAIIIRRNFKTYENSLEKADDTIKNLRAKVELYKQEVQILAKCKIASYAITKSGLLALPEGWEDKISELLENKLKE